MLLSVSINHAHILGTLQEFIIIQKIFLLQVTYLKVIKIVKYYSIKKTLNCVIQIILGFKNLFFCCYLKLHYFYHKSDVEKRINKGLDVD